MLAGPLNAQSLQQAFRTLSYRRQHGILWLGLEGEERIVLFQEGKIVSAASNRESTARAISDRLARAGFLSEKVVSLVSKTEVPVPQLYELIVGKQYVTHDEFLRAKTAHEFDLLHSLQGVQGGKMKFTPKAVRSDPRLSLSAFPGQVLLDMAELSFDQDRFQKLFSNIEATSVMIRQISEVYEGNSEPERIVFGVVDGSSSPALILSRCLLSRYEAMQALLSLFDQRLISVVTCEEPQAKAKVPRFVDTFEAIEIEDEPGESSEKNRAVVKALDQAVQGASDDFEGPREPLVEKGARKGKPSAPEAPNPAQQIALRKNLETLAAVPHAPPENKCTDAPGKNDLEDQNVEQKDHGARQTSQELSAVQAVVSSERTLAADSENYKPASLSSWAMGLNYYLLDVRMVRDIVLLATMLFLLAFALMGPSLIERWFEALSEFTSAT